MKKLVLCWCPSYCETGMQVAELQENGSLLNDQGEDIRGWTERYVDINKLEMALIRLNELEVYADEMYTTGFNSNDLSDLGAKTASILGWL